MSRAQTRQGKSGKKLHLVAFLHGLWGSAGDFANFVEFLTSQDDAKEYIFLPLSQNTSTMDGVSVGAERALKEVSLTLEKNVDQVDRISIVGHSLGGIYARYLVYLLDQQGFFEKLEPVVFATFATPHLGVRKPPGNPVSAIWNTIVLRLFQTTRELGLLDDSFQDPATGERIPILYAMGSRKEFLAPLCRFQRRALYSNIKWDFQVPYPTTAIRHRNPYSTRLFSMFTGSDGDDSTVTSASNSNSSPSSPLFSSSGPSSSISNSEALESSENSGSAIFARGARPPSASEKTSKLMANFTTWSLEHVDKRRYWHSARTVEQGLIEAHDHASSTAAPHDKYEGIDTNHEEQESNSQQDICENPTKRAKTADRSENAIIPCPTSLETAFQRDAKRDLLREMLFGLDVSVGGWERYDVSFLGVLAHEQIIYKRKMLPGRSVVYHFYKHILHPAHNHEPDPDPNDEEGDNLNGDEAPRAYTSPTDTSMVSRT